MEQATANDATCGVLIQEIKQAASMVEELLPPLQFTI